MIVDDPRHQALVRGLRQLDSTEIRRILGWPEDRLLLDGGNYVGGKFCPLAVALDIPRLTSGLPIDDATVSTCIAVLGRSRCGNAFLWNQMSGVPGTFYRDNRMADLREVATEILRERGDLISPRS